MHADALGTRLREAFGDAVRGAHDTLRLRATTVAQVARLMTLAREHAFRVAVPGGALIPGPGIVSLDLEGLARFNEVDIASQTVHVEAGALVSSVEAHLRARGLTLGAADPLDPREPVGAWLARGAPGARAHADDPVDQLVCGLEVVLADGTLLAIRPAPRRAVGPDLVPAFVGGRACLGVIVGAHLVARRATPRAEVAYRFATRDAAESARAWIRGHGVRPATTTISQDSLGAALQIAREQVEHHVGALGEPRVLLVVRVHKVLDLGHLKLAHAQQTRARRNLVAKREADLRGRKRHAIVVRLEQAGDAVGVAWWLFVVGVGFVFLRG
jgi:alkyldihydroxyacetonephosphate synthase